MSCSHFNERCVNLVFTRAAVVHRTRKYVVSLIYSNLIEQSVSLKYMFKNSQFDLKLPFKSDYSRHLKFYEILARKKEICMFNLNAYRIIL